MASVQRGTISLNNLASATATISSVDVTKSAVVLLGYDSTGTNATANALDTPYLTLTNATTVTATRINGPLDGMVVSFEVWTFNNVKSLHAGTLSITSGNATATDTFSAVTTAKAIILFGGFTNSNNAGITLTEFPYVVLTNTTTATGTRTSTGTMTTTISYTMVEFI